MTPSTLISDPTLAFRRSPVPSGSETAEAIVLGGHHWRRSPFDAILPRSLLPIAQNPLILHILDWLHHRGVARTTICSNGASALIRQHLSRYPRLRLRSVNYREDVGPRGPAGALRDAAADSGSEMFVVVEGSVIPDIDLQRLLDAHRTSGAAVTIVVQPARSERDVPAPVPAGIYVFSRSAIEAVPPSGFQDIKENLIPALYKAGAVMRTHEAERPCPRVIDGATYLRANHWLVTRIAAQRSAASPVGAGGSYSATGIVAHPSARIDPGADLIGPIVVGPRAVIEAGATLVGPVSVGRDTRVCARALVSRSVLWPDSVVGRNATIDRTVITDGATVEPSEELSGAVRLRRATRRPAAGRGSQADLVEADAEPTMALADARSM
jgi:NDP-sugar pyrophosphorylase family protein